MRRVGAVLLAAGGGSRFAGSAHKLRTPIGGRPLCSVSLDAMLGAGLSEPTVVTGAVDLTDLLPDGVQVVANPAWEHGIATSIAVAITTAVEAGLDAVVIGLADQPGVESAAWRAVATVEGGPIAVATYGGQRGNPVRLDREVWPLLAVTGDEGARSLMHDRPDLVTEIACEGNPADIDTEEDLARWS